MLNKDQYNQEEYNDYYRQEVEGSELGGSDEDENGLMSKLIMLLVLLALAVAGYFGYKAMNNLSDNDIDTSLQVSAESSLPQSVQKEVEEIVIEEPRIVEVKTVEAKVEEPAKIVQTNNVQSAVTEEVTKAVETQGKLSPEDVAAVVAAVMQQMNQEKDLNPTTVSNAVKEDVALINDLSNTQIDSVSSDLIKELENIDINEHTQVDDSAKQIDVYNKINVQNISGADTLSQLSEQINSVMAEAVTSDKVESYTSSLKSEVDVRENEMRIIVVRQGDTLGKIAKRAYGNVMDYQKIYRANPEVTRPDRIYIGQKLRIPN